MKWLRRLWLDLERRVPDDKSDKVDVRIGYWLIAFEISLLIVLGMEALGMFRPLSCTSC